LEVKPSVALEAFMQLLGKPAHPLAEPFGKTLRRLPAFDTLWSAEPVKNGGADGAGYAFGPSDVPPKWTDAFTIEIGYSKADGRPVFLSGRVPDVLFRARKSPNFIPPTLRTLLSGPADPQRERAYLEGLTREILVQAGTWEPSTDPDRWGADPKNQLGEVAP
jgi:hypothetical protein